MSTEDDAIIQAASKRLYDHVTIGGDTFACALSDTAYVSNMSETPADCQRMVRQMCDRAAAEVIRAYLGSLEAAGWAVVPRLMTVAQADAAKDKTNLVDIYRAMLGAASKPPGLGD